MPDGDGYLSEFDTNGETSRTAEKYRELAAGVLWRGEAGTGVRPGRFSGGLNLSALSSPARWQVSPGFAVVVASDGVAYNGKVTAAKVDNVASTSSGTTRLDRFIVRVRDKGRGHTENSIRVERIGGSETTGTPVVANPESGAVFLDLGTMLVTATGPSTVTRSNLITGPVGTILPTTVAQRQAIVGSRGDAVYDGDLRVHDGTQFAAVGPRQVSTPAMWGTEFAPATHTRVIHDRSVVAGTNASGVIAGANFASLGLTGVSSFQLSVGDNTSPSSNPLRSVAAVVSGNQLLVICYNAAGNPITGQNVRVNVTVFGWVAP